MKLILQIITSVLFSFGSMAQNQVTPAFENLKDLPKVRDLALSNNGREAYFTIQSPMEEISSILIMHKLEDNSWSKPKLVSFSSKFTDFEPFLSLDNLKLYFVSNRPFHDSVSSDFNIFYVERENLEASWSEPKSIGDVINTKANQFYPSIAANGNLYFTSDGESSKGKDDVFFSEWLEGELQTPISLSDSINSKGFEFNTYVAPDESFLIFSGYNREDGFGSGDLYISYKEGEAWTKAKNLGREFNSNAMDYCPYIDWKNKTLYFTSRRSAVMNDTSLVDFQAILDEVNSYENGLSRIYKVSIKNFLKE